MIHDSRLNFRIRPIRRKTHTGDWQQCRRSLGAKQIYITGRRKTVHHSGGRCCIGRGICDHRSHRNNRRNRQRNRLLGPDHGARRSRLRIRRRLVNQRQGHVFGDVDGATFGIRFHSFRGLRLVDEVGWPFQFGHKRRRRYDRR